MSDIDPAALSRLNSVATANPSALSLSKINWVSALPVQKTTETVSTTQRIDLEPLYTSLKAAIGDNWGKYKEAISLFVLADAGRLNQNELAFQVDHYVTTDPNIEHLHNQLIAGIYGNVSRDPPKPGVAPWVSANDKPTAHESKDDEDEDEDQDEDKGEDEDEDEDDSSENEAEEHGVGEDDGEQESEYLGDDRDDDIDEELARYSVFQDPEFQRLRAQIDNIRKDPPHR